MMDMLKTVYPTKTMFCGDKITYIYILNVDTCISNTFTDKDSAFKRAYTPKLLPYSQTHLF